MYFLTAFLNLAKFLSGTTNRKKPPPPAPKSFPPIAPLFFPKL